MSLGGYNMLQPWLHLRIYWNGKKRWMGRRERKRRKFRMIRHVMAVNSDLAITGYIKISFLVPSS